MWFIEACGQEESFKEEGSSFGMTILTKVTLNRENLMDMENFRGQFMSISENLEHNQLKAKVH